MAKRQLMITTCNFNLYQSKITKTKGKNSRKSIKSENFASDREALKNEVSKKLKHKIFQKYGYIKNIF
jgi:hypothetical protein